ncbi:MAG: transporter substrate-binding domain-containing protein [Halopseudomonas sp.]
MLPTDPSTTIPRSIRRSGKINRWLSGALIALLLSNTLVSRADDIRVGFYNAPPLMIQQSNSGIYHELLQQVGAITGDNFIIEYFSIARLQRSFEEGKLDLEPGVNPQWRQQSPVPGVYSDAFASLEQILLFRPGKALQVTGPRSLAGKQIGTIRGYIYPGFSQSFASGEIERIDVTDEPQLLRLLEKGRVDQVFIDRVVQRHWAVQNPQFKDYQASQPLSDIAIMLRLHPSRSGKLASINSALALLHQRGVTEQIFERYQ